MSLTEAQKRAIKKQTEKRAGTPRLPGSYISYEENELLTEMGEKYGSKKTAIFAGLSLLKNTYKKSNC
ncbi:hypothetical protein [uncultured Gilliamella sp.]|uniref:hypothetical protein n=1 Tax=uncultured Gilliamella sp. TaxID=1193505 RepID=UPI0025FC7DB2|nr:hypothetical protein [uncultured Gilliamella sp.]